MAAIKIWRACERANFRVNSPNNKNYGKPMRKILIIEDEQSIADTLVHSLEREGYATAWCARGLPGLELAQSGDYDLLVLDVGLPDLNGFELCKALRRASALPVIFLTARADEIDKIVGLEIGGDDYITKPFSPRELVARVKSVLRRGQAGGGPRAEGGPGGPNTHGPNALPGSGIPDQARPGLSHPAHSYPGHAYPGHARPPRLRIDRAGMRAFYLGRELELTRYEFRLLALLAAVPGQVHTREALMQQVWDSDSPSLDRTVDTHIKSLRAKFRAIEPEPDPFITRRGAGYALNEEVL